ncbi:MAG TPA: Na/Pi cotransporter family protein [Candidatus Faecousia intestinavium]|nr:Na/Pi cotransporter family protein [Candidatus Faecousia intestinavium]
MDIFDCLTMVGGLCLFLFGMNIMGEALERRAGASLRALLGKLTTNRMLGFLTGLAVTAVIQSSSATTVMVVGFVNSGLLTLGQAINVIMGANVGTTVTAWILSLGGIESSNVLVQLLKPSSFTPILALWGIVYYMFLKDSRKKDTGMIFLGFATLMFGMETMSDAVSGLKDVPAFQQLFLLFTNPILGVLAGAVLTAIIQSSSASVGILQALSTTGSVSYAAAIPIIMGQNIGTCITAMLSSVGTTKNAKRAAVVHLMFNILGTMICLILFTAVQTLLAPAILGEQATYLGIAICHTMFNVICTAILLPSGDLLEKLVCRLVPDNEKPEVVAELDERLLTTPSIALERCQSLTFEMADVAAQAIHDGVALVREFNPALAKQIREEENRTDHYEDILGTYLVKLSALKISDADSSEATMLLKSLNDFERIGDHALNLVESAEELQKKHLNFSDTAKHELAVLTRAVDEIVALSFSAFRENNLEKAYQVEPLEQVIDDLKEKLRVHHILRMQQGSCSIESGFVWSDLLTALERVGDHCSNIAGCVVDMAHHDMNTHESLRSARTENENFGEQYKAFAAKYSLK